MLVADLAVDLVVGLVADSVAGLAADSVYMSHQVPVVLMSVVGLAQSAVVWVVVTVADSAVALADG